MTPPTGAAPGPERPEPGRAADPPDTLDRAYGVVDPSPAPGRGHGDDDGTGDHRSGSDTAHRPSGPGATADADLGDADDTADRLLAFGMRPRRTIGRLVDVAALAGAVVTASLAVLAVAALVDLADRVRDAVGFEAPTTGVDWFVVALLAATVVLILTGVAAVRAAVRRRHRRRLAAVLGPDAAALGRGPRPGLDRRRWLAELLRQPGWAPSVERWQATGRLPATAATGAPDAFADDATYRRAAALVRDEVSDRVGRRALATGLAVAVARSRVGDAAAVISGSAEIQLDTLASLGLRPTGRAHLRVARGALAGVAASSYLDIEDRLELELTVRAAVLGLESVGDAADAVDDVISDDLAEALAESFGGGSGAIGAAAGLVGGAFGVTGSVLRQVADLTEAVGAEITEGLVIAALLHHQGMTLAADALGLDDAHRAELTPTAGIVPAELVGVAAAVARRYRRELRRMLRRRATTATRSAPRAVTDRLRRRDRGT
ncbi:MAG: hypothetical protein S0880_01955 [Actinomycetota bacterium]|nr:hypothetical protein [Actinomycetota bacterium]